MRHLHIHLLVCVLFAQSNLLVCEPLISFFFHAYPYDIQDTQNFIKKLHKPEKLAKYQQAAIACVPRVSGIFCSYAGFLTASSQHGQIIFPRKHSSPIFTFVVTPTITPVVAFGLTVQHLVMPSTAAIYTAKLEHNQSGDLHFWSIEPGEIPKDNIVPLDAIIIFARPEKVYIPHGITLTQKSPHALLPDIYIKKGVSYAQNSLFVLTIRHFFAPVSFSYKKEAHGFAQQIRPS